MSTGGSDRRVVDGRFELVERLGAGGMGWVWRAHDTALHRDVAVKEVRPPDPALAEYDPEGARTLRERVLREARALARVHHPNVVTIHHIVDGGDRTYPWIVMELVTGGSLQDRLDRGTLTPREAAGLGRELLSALRAAHAVGIEHRDVKPANVLLRPDGRPVLTDFGIAALRESVGLTVTGAVIGSPDFMAPERVTGKEGGPAADLWSLAMLLYVAVEGHHPMRRGSTLATLAAVLAEDVPPPVRSGPLTPVLAAVLVRDPLARPDADTLDRMLAAVTDAHPAPSAPHPYADGPPAGTFGPPATPYTPPAATPPGAYGPPAAARPAQGSPTSYSLSPPALAPDLPTPAPSPVVATVTPGGRRPRRGRVLPVLSVVVAMAFTGVLVWSLRPDDGDTTDSGKGTTPGAGATRTPGPKGSSSGDAAPVDSGEDTDAKGEKVNLLTADGLRRTQDALTAVMGGSKVTRLVVYPEYAMANALVPGKTKSQDSYMYRGGDVAVKQGPGGSAGNGVVPVDLKKYDWDAVPKLFAKAERTLNVPDPTSRYLVIEPASTVFDTEPAMLVYLADDYGGGYLRATVRGEVIASYPRED
ncbi:protein kinase [Streptomyces sp. NPDC091281]|uniref:serine/threonine-protein kinase n=1 Tax=Streptomyces sp. NPDC091281 TaxID=3365985 RepID=UPI003821A66D